MTQTLTTTTIPNKRKRGRPAKRRKPMVEQPITNSPKVNDVIVKVPTETTSKTIKLVESHIKDVYLIERDALWNDFQNRLKINNYEVSQVYKELKGVVKATNELLSKPFK